MASPDLLTADFWLADVPPEEWVDCGIIQAGDPEFRPAVRLGPLIADVEVPQSSQTTSIQ